MSRRTSKAASTAFTGAVAAMTLGMIAAQARAASSWHIKNNGVGYHGAILGHQNGTITFRDNTRGLTVACTADARTGFLPSSMVPGDAAVIGKITREHWSACTINGTIPVSGSLTTFPDIHAVSYAAGVTTGFVGTRSTTSSVVQAKWQNRSGCMMTWAGEALPFTFVNASHTFRLNPTGAKSTWHVRLATSCGGFRSRDAVGSAGKIVISTPNALTITRS